MTDFYHHQTLPKEHYVSILKRLAPTISLKDVEKIHGYDSVVLIINKERLFKFPQRDDVFDQYKREITVFPFIEERCSFQVPSIVQTFGTMGEMDNFILEYRIMPGDHLTTELEKFTLTSKELKNIGGQVGDYLSELHNLNVEELIKRGVNSFDATYWRKQYDFVKEKCLSFWNKEQQTWVVNLYENFLSVWDEQSFTPVFIHGDMGNWHIFSEKEKVVGFIDWGGMKIDDPARDLLWHEKENTVDRAIGEAVLEKYQSKRELDTYFFERTNFYKKRAPISKFIKGVQFNDQQRIADGYKLLEQAMAAKT